MADQDQSGEKSPLSSKTINFNWINALAIPIILPFVPRHLRDQDWFISSLGAYLTLANIALRFVTSEAIKIGAGKCREETKR